MMKKTLLALIATVVICMLLSAPVLAAKGGNGKSNSGNQPDWSYSDKPGWGYGDTNHDHYGPPGWGDGDKPGWGYGDTNHDHYGPPGYGQGATSNYNYDSSGRAGLTSFLSLQYRWKSIFLGEGVKGWLSRLMKTY